MAETSMGLSYSESMLTFKQNLQRRVSPSIFIAVKSLKRTDRRKLIFIALFQIVLSALDLFGVIAFGLVGALSVSGVESHQPGNRVTFVIGKLGLSNSSFQTQVMVIGLTAAFLLVSRTLISMVVTKYTLFFLANRSADLSSRLVSKLLKGNLLNVRYAPKQEILYALTIGVDSIMLSVLGNCISLASDIFLLGILSIGLILVDPGMAIGTILLFVLVAFLIYRFVHKRVETLARENADLTVESNTKIMEVLSSYREIFVRGIRRDYAQIISNSRFRIAKNNANLSQIPNISKYVIEITTVLGAIAITATQFLLQNAIHAVATLAVFIAAGSRIAPAVMRIQNSAVAIRSSIGSSGYTMELLQNLENLTESQYFDSEAKASDAEFSPHAEMKNLSFSYPGSPNKVIDNLNLKIESGEFVAIVGPSGAGKTTVVDLLLGILKPDEGSVNISGHEPENSISMWPGSIGYVPQESFIAEGSIRTNIIFGFKAQEESQAKLSSAVEQSDLSQFLESLENGIDHILRQSGDNLSGGQIQRIGIARALYPNPKFLVLDEATSSLDGSSEESISKSIQRLRGKITVVIIAHRLSSVVSADKVVYLDKGTILGQGTFSELRKNLVEFDHQAKLMGL